MTTRRPPAAQARVAADEIANAIIQGTGTLLAIAGLVVLVIMAARQGGALPVTASAIYGATLVLAFLMSTLYHATWHTRIKRFFQTADHCTIYALIAGTYTPIALLVLQGTVGWVLTAIVWAIALVGVSLRILFSRRFRALRVVLYIAMGWLILLWGQSLAERLGLNGTVLLVAGGLAYTLGVVFYKWNRLPFNRPIWHLFVVAGSTCHFIAIAVYALPLSALPLTAS